MGSDLKGRIGASALNDQATTPSSAQVKRPAVPRSRVPLLTSAALVAVTLVAFWPVLRAGFIQFDDDVLITLNPMVRRGLTLDGLTYAWTTNDVGYPIPLTLTSFMLDVSLFGLNPHAFHAENLLLHAANAVLVYLLFRQMTGSQWRSALAAGLFVLHPLRVESVAWVTERKDVLAMFLGLLGLLAYVAYARNEVAPSAPLPPKSKPGEREPNGSSQDRNRTRCRVAIVWYVVAFILWSLSLAAKPLWLPMSGLLLILDLWPLQRLNAIKAQSGKGRHRSGRSRMARESGRESRVRVLLEKVPFLAIAVIAAVMGSAAQHRYAAKFASVDTSGLDTRSANATVAAAMYLWKTVWPARLAVYYPRPEQWPAWEVAAAAAVLAIITAAALLAIRRAPWLAFGWFWYTAALFPACGVSGLGDYFMADRYTYLPGIGLIVMVVWSLPSWRSEGVRFGIQRTNLTAAGLSVFVLTCLAVTTHVQAGYWIDTVTLFRHTAAVTSDNWMAHHTLSKAHQELGDRADARAEARITLDLAPDLDNAHMVQSDLLAEDGDTSGAAEEYRKTIALNPELAHHPHVPFWPAHRPNAEAKAHLERAVSLSQAAQASAAHAASPTVNEALQEERRAIAADPLFADAYTNYGFDLASAGRLNEAVAAYRQALAANPHDADAHVNLAAALRQMGRPNEAADHAWLALKARADWPDALFELGSAEMLIGKYDAAIDHLTSAVKASPNDADARRQLQKAMDLRRRMWGR